MRGVNLPESFGKLSAFSWDYSEGKPLILEPLRIIFHDLSMISCVGGWTWPPGLGQSGPGDASAILQQISTLAMDAQSVGHNSIRLEEWVGGDVCAAKPLHKKVGIPSQ